MLSMMLQTSPEASLSARYTRALQQYRWCVIGFWLAALPPCIVFGVQFIGEVSLEFEPPPNSRAARDRETFRKYFPDQVGANDFALLLEWGAGAPDPNAPIQEDQGTIDVIRMNTSANGMESIDNYTELGLSSFSEALRGAVYQRWCSRSTTELLADIDGLVLPSCARGETRPDGTQTGMDLVSAMNGYSYTAPFSIRAAENLLLSGDRTRSLIQITFQGSNLHAHYPDREKEFAEFLDAVIFDNPDCASTDGGPVVCTKGLKKLFLEQAHIEVSTFSLAGGMDEIVSEIAKNLLLVDGIAVPVGLLLAALALRNARLVWLPLAAIVVTIFASFAVMRGVVREISVNAMIAPIMMSLAVGLPVHSCLFLLNRFREALLEGEPVGYAVQRMLRTAGHTVLVSQLAMVAGALPFLGAGLDTVTAMATALIAVSCVTVLSSLTLCPALLVAAPGYFEAVTVRTAGFALGLDRPRTQAAMAMQLRGARTGLRDTADPQPSDPGEAERPFCGCCGRVSALARRTPAAAVVAVLVLGATAPFAVALARGPEYADGVGYYLPRRASLTKAAERIMDGFGRGTLSAFKIGLYPRDGVFVNMAGQNAIPLFDPDDSYFVEGHGVVDAAIALSDDAGGDISADDVAGAYYFKSLDGSGEPLKFTPMSVTTMLGCVNTMTNEDVDMNPPFCILSAAMLLLNGNSTIDANNLLDPIQCYSMFALHKPQVDPMTPRGSAMVDSWRRAADTLNDNESPLVPVSAAVFGLGANSADTIEHMSRQWHWIGGVMVAAICVVVLAFTGSIGTTVIGVMVAASTTTFALGFTMLVYRDGILDWTGFASVATFEQGEGSGGAIFWGIPVLTTPLLVGISLGYHLFQASAAQEWYHRTGIDVEEAIHLGVESTSGLCCASLGAMLAAFSGHLFSQMPLLNQAAMPLCAGLAWEALLARPLLAPALAQLLGPLSFWPFSARNPAAYQYLSIRVTGTDSFAEQIRASLEDSLRDRSACERAPPAKRAARAPDDDDEAAAPAPLPSVRLPGRSSGPERPRVSKDIVA